MKRKKIITRSDNPLKDWVKDFDHENGNYTNMCIRCGSLFMGHKRRVVCHECTYPTYPNAPVLDFTDIFHYTKSLQAVSGMTDDEASTLYHVLDMWQQKRYFEPTTWEIPNTPGI